MFLLLERCSYLKHGLTVPFGLLTTTGDGSERIRANPSVLGERGECNIRSTGVDLRSGRTIRRTNRRPGSQFVCQLMGASDAPEDSESAGGQLVSESSL